MFNKIKHSFKQTAIYSFGNLSTKLIGLILLPLFTKYLSTSEYGILAVLEATSQILIGVLALNLPLAMLRWASAEKDLTKQKSIIFTTVLTIIPIAGFQLLLLIPNTNYFSNLIFGNENFSDYFFYLFITVAFGIYNGVPLNIIRIKEKAILFISVSVIKFTSILLSNIYTIVYLGLGVKGIIISQVIGEIILFLVTLPIVIKNTYPRFDKYTFREMLKFGIPLILSTVSIFIFTFADRYIIKYFLDDASVGIYSLGYKIASIINMLIIQSFQLGFLPIAYKKLGEPDEGRFFSKIITYYSYILVFAALVVSFFSKELIMLIAQDKDYWIAYIVVPIISYSFVLKGIQFTFALGFHYAKKTFYNALITILMAIINLGLNFLLIPYLGYIGAAYSMMLSSLITLLLSYKYAQKVYYIKYEIKKIIILISLGITFYIISIITSNFGILLNLFSKLILLVLFPFTLVLFKFYEQIELVTIKNIWVKWKNPLKWKNNLRKFLNF